MRWEPKCAVVTGASSGIGRATALELARRGVHVVAIARREGPLSELVENANGAITAITLDVTDEAAVAALPARLADMGHSPDVLVNNAGYGQIGPVEDTTLDAVRAQFETNVLAPIALIQAFLPTMRTARRGRIVNMSSVSGMIGLPFMGVYSASKFALEGLSDSLRLELAQFGIEVVLVEPAATATGFSAVADSATQTADARTDAYKNFFNPDNLKAASDAQAAPLSTVVPVVVDAVLSQRPRTRYVVPARGRRLVALARLLSDRRFDALIARRFSLPRARV